MDMLFHRYASPMVILDKMISAGRLTEFVREFVSIRNEELVDKTRWEFWLHRVFDMSFGDFLARSAEDTPEEINAEELTETVNHSLNMVNSFCPF